MDSLEKYIHPELLVVAIVLYFLGMWMKQAEFIKDKYIPIVLGGLGILICSGWIFAKTKLLSGQNILEVAFASITQGVLVAGLSTYVNQIIKQIGKKE